MSRKTEAILEIVEDSDAVIEPPDDAQAELSASEALFGFCAWLTTREEETMMGGSHDCGVIAELVKRFVDFNGLQDPKPGWDERFKMPVDTDFGKARDLMWETFQKDPEFKSTYEANVACLLMDNIPGLKRGEKAIEKRNEVATLIMDRIFSA